MLSSGSKNKLMQFVVVSFCYAHIFCTISWSLPDPPKQLKIGIQNIPTLEYFKNWSAVLLYWNKVYIRPGLVTTYIDTLDLRQNWNMFAPNPITHDVWVSSVVTLADGSTRDYEFPRPEKKGYGERFVMERYRKFIESVQRESYAHMWPPLAEYIAASVQKEDPSAPQPVKVELYRHTKYIAPPGVPQPEQYSSYIFFETPVGDKDAQHMVIE